MTTDRKKATAPQKSVTDDNQPPTKKLGFHSASSDEIMMTDPYIAANGKSYDKSEVKAKKTKLPKVFRKGTYPNAALGQAIKAYEHIQEPQHQEYVQEHERVLEEIKAAKLQLSTQQKEMQQLDLRLATASPSNLRWKEIKPKASDEKEIREIKHIISTLEAVKESFNCAYSLELMDDPIFCVDDRQNYNSIADGISYKKFLNGKKTTPNHHFKKTIAKYPHEPAEKLITVLKARQELMELQAQISQNASVLKQKREFLEELRSSSSVPTAVSTTSSPTPTGSPYRSAPPSGTPGGSPYRSAPSEIPAGPGPASHPKPSPTPEGPSPSPYLSPEASTWKAALDAQDSADFVKLLAKADDQKLAQIKIGKLSVAEYLAFHSSWPALPLADQKSDKNKTPVSDWSKPSPSIKDRHNKKMLLEDLSRKKVKLPDLLKAATLGDAKELGRLLQMPPQKRGAESDAAGCHFLRYALANKHDSLVNKYRTRSDSIGQTAENLWQQHTEKLAQLEKLEKQTDELFQAVKQGHVDAVRKLLNDKAKTERPDFNPLYFAANQGYTDIAQALVEAKAMVNVRLLDGDSPLLTAISREYYDIVNLLVANGVDVNAEADGAISPLLVATAKGHIDTVRLLIANHANMEIATISKKHTALFLAVTNRNTEVVRELVKAKANTEAANKIGATSLHIAAQQGDDEIMNLLLEAKANIEATNIDGSSPLSIAASERKRKSNVLSILLGAKANIDITNCYGNTPLSTAAMKGYNDVLDILLEAKANITIKRTTDGQLPLHMAATAGNLVGVGRLLDAETPIDVTTSDGCTPLHQAAAFGRDDVVQLLMGRKANIEAKAANRATAIWFAANKGHETTVKLLAGAGAATEIVVSGDGNETPLHTAITHGHHNAAIALLEAKANVNICGKKKLTPLHFAASVGDERLVEQLIMAKASIGAVTEDGDTPFSIAKKFRRTKIMELITKAAERQKQKPPLASPTPTATPDQKTLATTQPRPDPTTALAASSITQMLRTQRRELPVTRREDISSEEDPLSASSGVDSSSEYSSDYSGNSSETPPNAAPEPAAAVRKTH